MKKFLLYGSFGAVLLFGAAFSFSNSNSDLSDLQIANIEALAQQEVNPMCPNGCYDNGNGCYCHYWFPTYKEAGNN